jgi:hypothetical protein
LRHIGNDAARIFLIEGLDHPDALSSPATMSRVQMMLDQFPCRSRPWKIIQCATVAPDVRSVEVDGTGELLVTFS